MSAGLVANTGDEPGQDRLACQRYIELNPVRANMINPAYYRWTSYRHSGWLYAISYLMGDYWQ